MSEQEQPSQRLRDFIDAAKEPVPADAQAIARVTRRVAARPTVASLRPAQLVLLGLLLLGAFSAGIVTTLLMVRQPAYAPLVLTTGAEPVEVTFALVADSAHTVSLVGDFNDWNPARTRMERGRDGVWKAVIELQAGSYSYAFLVDGVRWQADPFAPPAADEDFGRPSSVMLVSRRL